MLFRSIRQACHVFLVAAALVQAVDCLGVDATMAGDASPVDIASLRSLPLPALGASPGSVADHRVVVRGVVTWLTRGEVTHDYCVVQDETAGIWVNVHLSRLHGDWRGPEAEWNRLTPGMELEVTGAVDVSGYAPMIVPEVIRILSDGVTRPLPAPKTPTKASLFSGSEDSQRIVVEGILQGYRDDVTWWILVIAGQSGRFLASVPKTSLPQPPDDMVDGTLRVIGVAASRFTARGQFVSPTIHVRDIEDITVVTPPQAEPFDAPAVSLEHIDRFQPMAASSHRIRTEGVVTHAIPGQAVYIQRGAIGVRVETQSRERLVPGDVVEVSGFIDRSRVTAEVAAASSIVEAIVRRLRTTAAPAALPIQPDDLVALNKDAIRFGLLASPGDYDGCLVAIRARLVESQRTAEGGALLLVAGKSTLAAIMPAAMFEALPAIEIGSELVVRGIVQCDLAATPGVRPMWHLPSVERMTILPRTLVDVSVVNSPSWWTPRRLGMLLGGVALGLTIALVWVWLLRRQVAATTRRLAAEMRSRRDAAVEYQATIGERNRLAANLHDTLLQTLGGIGYQLDACEAGGLLKPDGPRLHFDVARRMVNHANGELQRSVWAMRSLPIPDQALSQSLRILAARLGEGHHAAITVETSAGVDDAPAVVAGQILLIVQEAITNALRHGRPKSIRVNVASKAEDDTIHVIVRDDGAGFEMGEQRGTESGHFGIHGMRERAEQLGGSLRIESQPGEGTTVHAVVARRAYDAELTETGES
jgi:signal transduction histidine kinase